MGRNSNVLSLRNIGLLCLMLCWNFISLAQEKDSVAKLEITGFAELYYGYDFDDNTSGSRFPFLFSHNRKNQVAVNLALIKAAMHPENFAPTSVSNKELIPG